MIVWFFKLPKGEGENMESSHFSHQAQKILFPKGTIWIDSGERCLFNIKVIYINSLLSFIISKSFKC